MKKIFILSLVMVTGLAVYGQAFARGGFGRGMGNAAVSSGTSAATTTTCAGRGFGPGNGTCTIANIFEGEAVTVSGTIADIAYYGQGFQVETGEKTVTVYGLGPIWYWEQLGVKYPAVGDEIKVNGYNVTFSDGSVKFIAASVIVGDEEDKDQEIALRDSDTGAPLWRGGQGRGFRGNGGACPYAAPAAEATE